MYREDNIKSKILADSRMENFDIEKQLYYYDVNLEDVFSKKELEAIDSIKKDGRKLHTVFEKNSVEDYELCIWLIDCATTNYPSSMMDVDIQKHYFSEYKEKVKLFRCEIIEPYLERNGVNGLIFMNYIDKHIVNFAVKHSNEKNLKLFLNYLEHLTKNLSTFDTKVDLNENDIKEIKEKVLEKLQEKTLEQKNKNYEISLK